MLSGWEFKAYETRPQNFQEKLIYVSFFFLCWGTFTARYALPYISLAEKAIGKLQMRTLKRARRVPAEC